MLHRHFSKWEHFPISLCVAAAGWAWWMSPNRFCSEQSLWTRTCLILFYFIWEQQSGWTTGMMENDSPDGVCPGDTLLKVKYSSLKLCSLVLECSALHTSSPERASLHEGRPIILFPEKPENLSSSDSSWLFPSPWAAVAILSLQLIWGSPFSHLTQKI